MAKVRLYIARRIAVDPCGDCKPERGFSTGVLWRASHCGEGKFEERTLRQNSVSWKGTLRASGSMVTPAFVAQRLMVEDVLILSVVPPDPQHSLLKELREIIPMQFATDGCSKRKDEKQ